MLRFISIFSAVLSMFLVSGAVSGAGEAPLALGLGGFAFDPLDVVLTAGSIVGAMALVTGMLLAMAQGSIRPAFVGIAMAVMFSSVSSVFEATELEQGGGTAAAIIEPGHTTPADAGRPGWGGEGF